MGVLVLDAVRHSASYSSEMMPRWRLHTARNYLIQTGMRSSTHIHKVRALRLANAAADRRRGVSAEDGGTWELRMKQMQEYLGHHGHCDVPVRYAANPQLGTWVRRVRYDHKCGNLPLHQVQELTEMGFKWTISDQRPGDGAWEVRFRELKAFEEEHGHCNVPREKLHLLEWVNQQRQLQRAGKLRAYQQRRLDSIQLDWEAWPLKLTRDERWAIMFGCLSDFQRQNGHCRVPRDYPPCPGLCRWVYQQRCTLRSGRMTDDRRSQLDSIGFDWGAAALLREKDEGDSMWHERMADLWAKVKEEGRGAFFCLDDPTSELAAWLRQQGHLRRVGKLGPEREKALEALGVCWADVDVGIESSEEQWTAKFERLVAFKEAHGHCDVPSTFQEDLALARWVYWQRHMRRKNTMSPQREEALNSTGFNWGEERQDPDELWNARLHEFATFLAEHGHGRVPSGWAPNPALGKWVDRQRQLRRACRLRPDRQAALEREGFDWGAGPQPNSEQLWLQRMAELAEYRSRYGNCVVPQRWTENQALGRWVAKQRRRRWELPEERRERLDALGFEWSAK